MFAVLFFEKIEVQLLRIYLDVCSYNRPFDNQDQDRVYLESESVLTVLAHCQNDNWTLVASDIVDFEINNIKNQTKKEKILELRKIAREWICITKPIEERAVELQKFGIKPFDSFHLALAENSGVDVFLSTDDKLIKASNKLSLNVKVKNPLNWISEVL